MSDTASGFVRIAALVMMTALFGIVWRSDQHTQQQFIIARKSAEQAELFAQHSAHREAAERLHTLQTAPAPDPEFRQNRVEDEMPVTTTRMVQVEIEMELPAEIAPGTYQIVDRSGHMQKVRIPAAKNAGPPRDLYVMDHPDGNRRYFIRISADLDDSRSQTAAGLSRPRR